MWHFVKRYVAHCVVIALRHVTKPIYVETKLFESSKFEQDVLEPKDHLLMLIAAAAALLLKLLQQ